MKKILLILSSIISGMAGSAQKTPSLHTPAEILKIMTESTVQYELNQLEKPIAIRDLSDKLNYNDVYRQKQGAGFSAVKYTMSKTLKEVVAKAEEAFQKSNIAEARKYYLEALSVDSTYYAVMTYIGQTYRIQKNLDKAIEWYEKVTRLNYIDYMAHWFLANAYDETGRSEEAKKEILVAHILNRNNPRIRASLEQILQKHNLKLNEWVFNPQYTLNKGEDNKIRIAYGEGWLIYALTKAVWAYEPGYSESMGYDKKTFFKELEEKEALAGLVLSEDSLSKALPVTAIVKKILADKEKNMLQEFIFYEILLPEHPHVANQLPDELIKNMADYILKIRCEKL